MDFLKAEIARKKKQMEESQVMVRKSLKFLVFKPCNSHNHWAIKWSCTSISGTEKCSLCSMGIVFASICKAVFITKE